MKNIFFFRFFEVKNTLDTYSFFWIKLIMMRRATRVYISLRQYARRRTIGLIVAVAVTIISQSPAHTLYAVPACFKI
jgi:hypothetical protein